MYILSRKSEMILVWTSDAQVAARQHAPRTVFAGQVQFYLTSILNVLRKVFIFSLVFSQNCESG